MKEGFSRQAGQSSAVKTKTMAGQKSASSSSEMKMQVKQIEMKTNYKENTKRWTLDQKQNAPITADTVYRNLFYFYSEISTIGSLETVESWTTQT